MILTERKGHNDTILTIALSRTDWQRMCRAEARLKRLEAAAEAVIKTQANMTAANVKHDYHAGAHWATERFVAIEAMAEAMKP